MSITAMSWAMDARRSGPMTPAARLVLMVLADRADDQGRAAWPSKETIAATTGLTERAVQRILSQLRSEGILVLGDQRLVDHLPGNRRPTVYNLAMHRRGDTGDSPEHAPETPRRGDTDDSPSTPAGETESTPQLSTGETERASQGRPNRLPNQELNPPTKPPLTPPAAEPAPDPEAVAAGIAAVRAALGSSTGPPPRPRPIRRTATRRKEPTR